MKLDAFTRAYIECALWSSMDNSNESGGEPLDRNYSLADIANETLVRMAEDCAKFQDENADLLAEAYSVKSYCGHGFSPEEYAGHDYWLTRNGHGAGFWDRGLGSVGEKLSEACRHKPFDLEVGDDGLIYGGF